MTAPAEKILREAIWAQVSSSLLAFIRINELPQIIHSTTNIAQLTNRSFFIMMGKGQQSSSERSNFFILCVIQITVYGKNFIEGSKHKSSQRF